MVGWPKESFRMVWVFDCDGGFRLYVWLSVGLRA